MSETFDPQARSLVVPVHIVAPREGCIFRCALDTASTYTVLPAGVLRRLGFDFTRPVGRTRLRTATGIAAAPLIRIPAINALGHIRTEFLVAAHDFPLGVEADGLLGLDFFRGRILNIDFIRGRISLSPRPWWQFW